MEREKVTVLITAAQGGALRLLSKRQRMEQEATILRLALSMSMREARIEVMAMRPEHWPNLEDHVAAAVVRRLEHPDLAGPWKPLSPAERAEMALAGRWPGPDLRVPLVQRSYAFPKEVEVALRTASWRVSEGPLRELRRLGAGADSARRDRLIARLHSPARIVRQALDEYGPRADQPEQIEGADPQS